MKRFGRYNKDNLSVKTMDKSLRIAVARLPDHIAENVNEIALADLRVPSTDKLRVHLLNCLKWTVIKPNHIFSPKCKSDVKNTFAI